jgi:hypothetical protein
MNAFFPKKYCSTSIVPGSVPEQCFGPFFDPDPVLRIQNRQDLELPVLRIRNVHTRYEFFHSGFRIHGQKDL